MGENPDAISMLNFEREMMINEEVDLLKVISADGELVEHDPCIGQVPDIPGKYPLYWEWTLQDAEGRIWTELVETIGPEDL